MKERIYEFERKYDTQDELLQYGSLVYLDERTLHNTIKAMLINTTKDCIILCNIFLCISSFKFNNYRKNIENYGNTSNIYKSKKYSTTEKQ